MQLLGATPAQLRRMALWESAFVATAALLVGAATTGLVGWLVRRAVTQDVERVGLTMPWPALLAILATCAGLALLAALVGSQRSARLRRRA